MAGKSLALFIGSNSTYDLEGVPSPLNQVFHASEQVVEEARAIIMKPLAIVPPQKSEASQGSTARSAAPVGGGKVGHAPVQEAHQRRPRPQEDATRRRRAKPTPRENYWNSLVTPSDDVCFHS